MRLMGLVALGYGWGRIVEAALARLAEIKAAALMRGKLTGRFFVGRMLPKTAPHPARIRLGAGNVM